MSNQPSIQKKPSKKSPSAAFTSGAVLLSLVFPSTAEAYQGNSPRNNQSNVVKTIDSKKELAEACDAFLKDVKPFFQEFNSFGLRGRDGVVRRYNLTRSDGYLEFRKNDAKHFLTYMKHYAKKNFPEMKIKERRGSFNDCLLYTSPSPRD